MNINRKMAKWPAELLQEAIDKRLTRPRDWPWSRLVPYCNKKAEGLGLPTVNDRTFRKHISPMVKKARKDAKEAQSNLANLPQEDDRRIAQLEEIEKELADVAKTRLLNSAIHLDRETYSLYTVMRRWFIVSCLCPHCSGRGQAEDGSPCQQCDGTGFQNRHPTDSQLKLYRECLRAIEEANRAIGRTRSGGPEINIIQMRDDAMTEAFRIIIPMLSVESKGRLDDFFRNK